MYHNYRSGVNMFNRISVLLAAVFIAVIPIQTPAQDLFELFESIEDSAETFENETDSMEFNTDSGSDNVQSDLFSEIEQSDSNAVEQRNFSIGLNLGGQLFNGDVEWTRVGWSEAFEIFCTLPLSDRFFISPAIGYGSLSDATFHIDKSHFFTNMYTFDIRFGSNLFSVGKRINSYFYLGLGLIRYQCERDDLPFMEKQESATSIFSGGGLEYQLTPKVGLFLQGDYRFTNTDALEGLDTPATAKDGYANIRFGVNYSFGEKKALHEDKVLADFMDLGVSNPEDSDGMGDFEDFAEGIQEAEKVEKENDQVDQIVKLKSRLEKLNSRIRQRESEISELKSQLEYKASRLAELQKQASNNNYSQPMYRPANEATYQVASNVEVSDFSVSYEEALRLFYERNYAQSISIFNSLLEVYPNHHLASNCQYWIGECYFGMKNYNAAIQSFQNIFSYNQSSKYDDSLLMIARCLFSSGDNNTARQYLEQLLQDYPDSEYKVVAESYLRN